MNYKSQIKELLKFLVGGGSAVFVDFITYKAFLKLGLGLSAAKAISYVCGAIVGFIINKLWTFESKGFSKMEIAKYIVLYMCSAIINAGINKGVILISHIEIMAFLCATGVSTVINYLGQKFFVFAKRSI